MKYAGRDNLDIMNLAKNYNNYIFNWVLNGKNYNEALDFGAGNGEYCNRINNFKITAIETDQTLRKNIKCTSFSNLKETGDKKFDLIYSLNVLEHIEDDLDITKQLADRLDDNGVLKILVPAKMELYSKMDENVGHFRRYEKEELVKLIENSNLEILDCRYFDFLGYFATLLYKIADNSGNIKPSSLIIYDKLVFPISIFLDKITFGKLIGKNLMIIARKNV